MLKVCHLFLLYLQVFVEGWSRLVPSSPLLYQIDTCLFDKLIDLERLLSDKSINTLADYNNLQPTEHFLDWLIEQKGTAYEIYFY